MTCVSNLSERVSKFLNVLGSVLELARRCTSDLSSLVDRDVVVRFLIVIVSIILRRFLMYDRGGGTLAVVQLILLLDQVP